MNKKELSTYLHKPQLLDRHAEIALQEVITDFPYFQAAHQLLLKAYQNKDSYHIDRQLPVASLLHGDRTILYDYLKEKLMDEFQETVISDFKTATEVLFPEESEQKVDMPVAEEEKHERSEVLERSPEPEILPESIDAHEVVDNELPFQNFEEKYLSKIPESETSTETYETVTQTDKPEEESVVVTPEAELRENVPEIRGEIPPVENDAVKEEVLLGGANVQEPETENAVLVKSEEEHTVPAEENKEEAPHDFLSWLQQVKVKAHHTPKPVEKEEMPVPLYAKETPVDAETREQKEEADKKLKKFNALIDRFIETNPSISKPQPTKFYNAAEKAKESLVENFDMVTETLAKIYIKQNNYRKAIMVYEKLSLIYPEKISYFATQIQNLKELLNNK